MGVFRLRDGDSLRDGETLRADSAGTPLTRITQQHAAVIAQIDTKTRVTQQHAVPITQLDTKSRVSQQHVVPITYVDVFFRMTQQHVVVIAQDPVVPPIPPIDDDKIPPISEPPPAVIRRFRFPFYNPITDDEPPTT